MTTDSEPESATVELSTNLNKERITYWRLAISKAASEDDVKKSAKAFFKSLWATGTRYSVRELGRG